MISPDWVRVMARYNGWQNGSILNAAGSLSDEERRADRGAFFGSIHGTLSHLLWGDTMWMSRFAGIAPPEGGISESPSHVGPWLELCMRRSLLDAAILDWAAGLRAADLEGDLTWWSGAAGRQVSKSRAILVTHFFNHQTHHRGQVHALLTAAGAGPDDTDLFLMQDS